MARYAYLSPPGWLVHELPPPREALCLRSPDRAGSSDVASILLYLPVAPSGTLAEQLALIVRQGVAGARVHKTCVPVRFQSAAYPGLMAAASVTIDSHDEGRIFGLLDAGCERLPVVFIGGSTALPHHAPALQLLLGSIRPSADHESMLAPWAL